MAVGKQEKPSAMTAGVKQTAGGCAHSAVTEAGPGLVYESFPSQPLDPCHLLHRLVEPLEDKQPIGDRLLALRHDPPGVERVPELGEPSVEDRFLLMPPIAVHVEVRSQAPI